MTWAQSLSKLLGLRLASRPEVLVLLVALRLGPGVGADEAVGSASRADHALLWQARTSALSVGGDT